MLRVYDIYTFIHTYGHTNRIIETAELFKNEETNFTLSFSNIALFDLKEANNVLVGHIEDAQVLHNEDVKHI